MSFLKIMIFVLFFAISSNAQISSLEQIFYRNLFEPEYDSTTIKAVKQLILQKADSIKTSAGNGQLKKDESFDVATTFAGLDCLDLILLTPDTFVLGGPIYHYQIILFNTCDSSIYAWGGNIEDYSNLIECYLANPEILDSSVVLGLIELYLNTINFYNPRVIIRNFNDFENLFSDKRLVLPDPVGSKYKLYPQEEAKRDKSKVKNALMAYKYFATDDTISVNLCSWSIFKGTLEYWGFIISRGKMEISEHKVLLEFVGPYRRVG
jgi:hypothetical protein